MEVCKVCQVEKHGLVFKTEQDRTRNKVSSSDFVKTRICRYATKQGCINVDGQIDAAQRYNNSGITAEQWLDTARELVDLHNARQGLLASYIKET